MALYTADEVLEKVGSFGWYQKRLLVLFNLLAALLFGWAVMVTGIITAEPPWKCAQNSSVCAFDKAFSPGDDNYDHRCNISRSEWYFVDDMTTIVTEVRELTWFFSFSPVPADEDGRKSQKCVTITIGHFRGAVYLSLKARLSVKLFI